MKSKFEGISYHDEGLRSGTPIVLIHGFPLAQTMWKSQSKMLSRAYRVITYDVRGHGHSDLGDGQYSIDLFVDDLIGLLDFLKIPTAILCGLSMGGYIALRAVERHPDRMIGLILCDTKSEADSTEAKTKRAEAMRLVKEKGVEAYAQIFIKSVLDENTIQTKPKTVAFVLDLIRNNSSVGICGTLAALAERSDTTAALPKINRPTLILVGENDRVTPPAAAEAMAKAIVGAQLHRIPRAGHLSNLENPEEFNKQVLTFLQQRNWR